MGFKAPYLPYDQIRDRAKAFLREYHPDRSIPVPIDLIVERDFGMDIITIPGIQENYDTVAFISRDFTTIYVDEYVFRSRENRYRFSIAHELGHRLLHAESLKELEFHDTASWKQVQASIPEQEYGYLEFHANSFAGLVLVPGVELREAFLDAVGKARGAGVDLAHAGTGARESVESYIGRQFVVSQETVHRRMEFDRLWDELA